LAAVFLASFLVAMPVAADLLIIGTLDTHTGFEGFFETGPGWPGQSRN